MLCSMLICGCLSAIVTETGEVKVCKCIEISVNTNKLDAKEGCD